MRDWCVLMKRMYGKGSFGGEKFIGSDSEAATEEVMRLSPEEEVEFEAHVKHCPECQKVCDKMGEECLELANVLFPEINFPESE